MQNSLFLHQCQQQPYSLNSRLCSLPSQAFAILLGLCFHNHQQEFLKVEGEVILDYWLQNTNPKYVHFQADLHWMMVGGVNPIDYFTKYPGRFFSWHVKDEAELGQSGALDFVSIFKYAKQSGLKYTLVEIEKFNYDPLISVEMCYHYLYNSQFECWN